MPSRNSEAIRDPVMVPVMVGARQRGAQLSSNSRSNKYAAGMP
ncbi:hypothetical protein WBP07_32545 [Novosphingobium sp. BL-8A]